MTDTSTIVRAPATAPGSVITRPLNAGGPTVVRTIGTAGRDGAGAPPGGTADYAVPSSHGGSAMWDNPATIRARGLIVNDATANNTSTLQAILNAALFSSHPREVELPPGDIYWDGLLTVPKGSGLRGSGGGTSSTITPGTRLVAKSSSATIEFRGSSGRSRSFTIDGADVATRPFVRGGVADAPVNGGGSSRFFEDVHVTRSALHGFTIEVSQNDVFIGCQTTLNAGAGTCLDWGMGGTTFIRCEHNANVGGSVLIQQSGTQSSLTSAGYDVPSHVTFDHCVFERNGTVAGSDVSTIRNLAGQGITFRDCRFPGVGTVAGATSSDVYLAGASRTVFAGNNKFSNTSAAITTIQLADTAKAWNVGQLDTQFCTGPDLDAPPGTKWFGSGGTWLLSTDDKSLLLGPNTVSNGNASTVSTIFEPMRLVRQATTDQILDAKIGTDVGPRWRLFADGKMSWGDATAFAWDVSMWRPSAGALKTDGDFTAKRLLRTSATLFTFTGNVSRTLDASNADRFPLNLNSFNCTSLAVSNHSAGQVIRVMITQGATPKDVTWAAGPVWGGGAAPVMPQTAGATLIVTFISDGTTLYEAGRSSTATGSGVIYAGATAGGDLSGTLPNPTVAKLNGTSLAGLGTGLLKNTTGTGVPSIAVAADVPTAAVGATGPLAAATRLDQITAPTAAVALNAQKITGLANGSAASDAAAFGQIPAGYGISGGAVALTTASGSIGADVAISATTQTTILTTASLGIGTWLVTCGASVVSGGAAASYDLNLAVGTATATFAGQQSVGSRANAASIASSAGFTCIVTVTVAGTFVFQIYASAACTVKKLTTQNSYTNATGYAAFRPL